MRIGMSLTSGYSRHDSSKELMDNLIERVESMAALGFNSLSLGDHHVTRDHYFQVLPTMSRMSAHAGNMQLIPLFLLPFYHPILLAEQIAVLDVMSSGRTTMICCLGHQPEAHEAFQTPQRVRVSRFVETFEIVRRLCTEDDVSYRGKHYAFEGVSINPKPLQQPLPMWIGSSDIILRRDIHLASTAEVAHREAQHLFEKGYRGYGQREMEESLIVGGPEECIRYLDNMQRLGITHVLFRCAVHGQDQALQTIRLLGTEVIPQFRQ
jgi:alkanesulfonate monooxygenase SsuD/methylene tetrahydromethanopterin reductase-like flavin-dependent oxidoreductase (luciferase family)